MVVLIEAQQGRMTLDVSFAGYMGASMLNWSRDTHEVSFASLEGLSIALRTQYKDKKILPIGSAEFVQKACEIHGIELPNPLNVPDRLGPYLGRKVWTCKRSEIEDKWYPFFVKPKDELKLFTGFVAKSEKDFDLYPELKEWDGMLWCSEVMPDIVSEWRCYIKEGKVFNCSCYAGESLAFPDKNEILALVSAYTDAPAGYSLDVAVTKAGTKLIECNDAWALGYYGGDFLEYFRMVKARWLEILTQQAVEK